MGNNVTPWLIHVNVWKNPLQYCKVISLQLIKINEKKKEEEKNPMKQNNKEKTSDTKLGSQRESIKFMNP